MNAYPAGRLTAILADMNMTVGDFATFLQAYGDTGKRETIMKRLRRWDVGQVDLPGEVIVLLTLVSHVRGAVARLGGVATSSRA